MSNVVRMTPEQVRAHQARIKRAVARCGNCGEPMAGDRCGNQLCVMSQSRPTPSSSSKSRSFVLRLPVPQSVNHNTRPTASGGRILTDEHKGFRTTVALMVYDAKIPKLYGKLRVYIRLNAPRMDCDNCVKPTIDALQRAGAIDNDRNVDDLHVVRSTMIPAGFLDVEVAEL